MLSRSKGLMLVGVIVPATAFFGGWAIVTVDDVPEYAVAGKPLDLTYSVRQHGMGLMTGLAGSVTLTSGGKTITVPARSWSEGVYRARLNFPAAGTWSIKVQNGFSALGGDMLPLTVIDESAKVPAPMSSYDRGHQLYLAKGCAGCHTHQLTSTVATTKIGPDLSEPKYSAPYLAKFLANPATKTDWKGQWRMPNLGLKPAEITALIAFLNQEKAASR